MCFRKKTKIINPKLNISSKELVMHQPFKKERIYLDSKIRIPRNFVFIICSNNKSIDILTEENDVIDIKSMPNATRKFGLYNLGKKKRKRFFQASTYFVNLNIFENFNWEMVEFAELEDKKYGEYKTACFGNINFKINNPELFINYMFSEITTPILTSQQAEKKLKRYINSHMTKFLNRLNPLAEDLYFKSESIIKNFYEKLSNLLKEIGINLYNISLTETRFPPKILADLKDLKGKPVEEREWTEGEKATDEPTSKSEAEASLKAKFMKITTSTGAKIPFFKENMKPYFFDENELDAEEEVIEEEAQEIKKKKRPLWKGIDEKIAEEESKKIVNLDNIDETDNS